MFLFVIYVFLISRLSWFACNWYNIKEIWKLKLCIGLKEINEYKIYTNLLRDFFCCWASTSLFLSFNFSPSTLRFSSTTSIAELALLMSFPDFGRERSISDDILVAEVNNATSWLSWPLKKKENNIIKWKKQRKIIKIKK